MPIPDTGELFPGKKFISTVLESLETKHTMSGELARLYLQRAAMAGFLIGIFYLVNYTVIASFVASGPQFAAFGKFFGALMFGWALVFIYYSRSELLTSNMMIVSIGAYHRHTGWLRALRLLGLCYLGNFLGGLLIALVLWPSTLISGGVLEQMAAAAEHKEAYVLAGVGGWVDLLMRAVLCNFMINIAMLLVYNGRLKDDVTKCLVMVMSVFVFAFEGLEHSVANTVLFTMMGLINGIDVPAAIGNVVIALIGNFIGGGLLIGLYYAWLNDDARFLAAKG